MELLSPKSRERLRAQCHGKGEHEAPVQSPTGNPPSSLSLEQIGPDLTNGRELTEERHFRLCHPLPSSGRRDVVKPMITARKIPAEELALGQNPLTIDPQPKTVKAWVRFGSQAVRVDAKLARWTPQACGLTFEIQSTTHRCWVWANAVELVETP